MIIHFWCERESKFEHCTSSQAFLSLVREVMTLASTWYHFVVEKHAPFGCHGWNQMCGPSKGLSFAYVPFSFVGFSFSVVHIRPLPLAWTEGYLQDWLTRLSTSCSRKGNWIVVPGTCVTLPCTFPSILLLSYQQPLHSTRRGGLHVQQKRTGTSLVSTLLVVVAVEVVVVSSTSK